MKNIFVNDISVTSLVCTVQISRGFIGVLLDLLGKTHINSRFFAQKNWNSCSKKSSDRQRPQAFWHFSVCAVAPAACCSTVRDGSGSRENCALLLHRSPAKHYCSVKNRTVLQPSQKPELANATQFYEASAMCAGSYWPGNPQIFCLPPPCWQLVCPPPTVVTEIIPEITL